MLVRKNKSEEEIAKLFEVFKRQYKDRYTETAWEYIEENFWLFVFSNTAPDILMQIYHEIGIEAESGNFYKEHLRRIKNIFGLDRNIVDVASGKIPSFAQNVAYEQLKTGQGTITIYEPNLIIEKPKYHNMTLQKKNLLLKLILKSLV